MQLIQSFQKLEEQKTVAQDIWDKLMAYEGRFQENQE